MTDPDGIRIEQSEPHLELVNDRSGRWFARIERIDGPLAGRYMGDAVVRHVVEVIPEVAEWVVSGLPDDLFP